MQKLHEVVAPESADEALRRAVAKRMRPGRVTDQIWDDERVREARSTYLATGDADHLDDVVAAVRGLRNAVRRAAGLQSTAPKSPRRTEIRPGKLSYLESMHALAFAQAMANIAFEQPPVRYFWEHFLHQRWLSDEDAERLLNSPAVRLVPHQALRNVGAPLHTLESRFVEARLRSDGTWRAEVRVPALGKSWIRTGDNLPGSARASAFIGSDNQVHGHELAVVIDKEGREHNVGYWTGSTLAELVKRARDVASQMGWREAATAWFMLTGRAPSISPLQSKIVGNQSGQITMTFSPWVSDKTLLAHIRAARFTMLGRRQSRAAGKNYELFAFVESQSRTAGGVRPAWSTLFERWNSGLKESWGAFPDVPSLRRGYASALRSVRLDLAVGGLGGIGRFETGNRTQSNGG